MALEFWILLALGAAALILGAVVRLRRRQRSTAPPAERNVYPLW